MYSRAGSWLFIVLLCATVGVAQIPNLNSTPVDWSKIQSENHTLTLPGVFSIKLPEGGRWVKKGSGVGPTGSPTNVWEGTPASGDGFVRLVTMDVALAKVPEKERDDFIPAIANAFRRTGQQAMEKKGFTLKAFEIEPIKGTQRHARRAISRFVRDTEQQVNITDFLPLERIYIIGWEGTSEKEPEWFLSTRHSFREFRGQ